MQQPSHIFSLADLEPGQEAVIEGFDEDKVPLKLLEMGLLPGNTVLLKRVSPLGDPIHVRVVGFDLALRKTEAAYVLVSQPKNAAE